MSFACFQAYSEEKVDWMDIGAVGNDRNHFLQAFKVCGPTPDLDENQSSFSGGGMS